jgi:hypothetical protein
MSNYTYHGTRDLIALPGRSVQTFPSGLVRVERSFMCRKDDVARYRSILRVNEPMPFDDGAPAIDGLFIFPEPQEQVRDDGFVEFRVTAYGRTNLIGVIEYAPTEGNLLLQGPELSGEDEEDPIKATSVAFGRNLIFGVDPLSFVGRDAKLFRTLWNLPVQKIVVPVGDLTFTTLASYDGVPEYSLFDNGYVYLTPVNTDVSNPRFKGSPQLVPMSEFLRFITHAGTQGYKDAAFRVTNARTNAVVRLWLFADKIAQSTSWGRFVEITLLYQPFLPLISIELEGTGGQQVGSFINVTKVTR